MITPVGIKDTPGKRRPNCTAYRPHYHCSEPPTSMVIEMAKENAPLSQPNWVVIGFRNIPKLKKVRE